MLRRDFFEDSAALKLTAIFIALRRCISTNSTEPDKSVSRVYESLRYIHANYMRPLSNSMLAGIEYLSVSQYTELFKKCTGLTPHSYIIELRIRSACDLLVRSNLTIYRIAASVGYDDPHYFSRLFRRVCGISPERYRLENS